MTCTNTGRIDSLSSEECEELVARFDEEVARDKRIAAVVSPNSKPIAMGITMNHLAVFTLAVLIGLLPLSWLAWGFACVGAGVLVAVADQIDLRTARRRAALPEKTEPDGRKWPTTCRRCQTGFLWDGCAWCPKCEANSLKDPEQRQNCLTEREAYQRQLRETGKVDYDKVRAATPLVDLLRGVPGKRWTKGEGQ